MNFSDAYKNKNKDEMIQAITQMTDNQFTKRVDNMSILAQLIEGNDDVYDEVIPTAIERFNQLDPNIQKNAFDIEKKLLSYKNNPRKNDPSLITQAFESGNTDTIKWLFNNQNFKPDKKTIEVAADNDLHIDDFKKLVDLFKKQNPASENIDWGGIFKIAVKNEAKEMMELALHHMTEDEKKDNNNNSIKQKMIGNKGGLESVKVPCFHFLLTKGRPDLADLVPNRNAIKDFRANPVYCAFLSHDKNTIEYIQTQYPKSEYNELLSEKCYYKERSKKESAMDLTRQQTRLFSTKVSFEDAQKENIDIVGDAIKEGKTHRAIILMKKGFREHFFTFQFDKINTLGEEFKTVYDKNHPFKGLLRRLFDSSSKSGEYTTLKRETTTKQATQEDNRKEYTYTSKNGIPISEQSPKSNNTETVKANLSKVKEEKEDPSDLSNTNQQKQRP